MTTAQVLEMSVTVNNNSPIQDYVHPDDQTQPFEIISKFMKRMNFVIACLRPSQNVKFGIFTGSREVDGKEMYKKA